MFGKYKDVLECAGKRYFIVNMQQAAKDLGIDLDAMCLTHKLLLENVLRQAVKENAQDTSVVCAFEAAQNLGDSSKPLLAFKPARVLMQDFTGVPALVDLAALRDCVQAMGQDAQQVNPRCPVDCVIDHSVQVEHVGKGALSQNIEIEMLRNRERYSFLKWAQDAFTSLRVVPPGKGICHQVNLEYLAPVVMEQVCQDGSWLFPDTLVGLDSHTTMINGLGVLGWGVGGIEAESAMLGHAINMELPKVVGVRMVGALPAGATATDCVLTLTALLRRVGVVGKCLEFFGSGVVSMGVPERATIANMTPEFGATSSLFAFDEQTARYMRLTGRHEVDVDRTVRYLHTQGFWSDPNISTSAFSEVIEFDLTQVKPCLAGPKRPQDTVLLHELPAAVSQCLQTLSHENTQKKEYRVSIKGREYSLGHGDVVIAAITSCTNTSNPELLITAGLLAKKAVSLGLVTKPWVKTSFAPGSRVVTQYLKKLELLEPLERLGFHVVGYGCTTCIGNSGPLDAAISDAISKGSLGVSAVLSGNRNFEGRIHPEVIMNWLASPPLVLAYALTGTTCVDITKEPLGENTQGGRVYLADLWPESHEVREALQAVQSDLFLRQYEDVFQGDWQWQALSSNASKVYPWKKASTYIQKPGFVSMKTSHAVCEDWSGGRALLMLGDAVTTDHISPAGAIKEDSPAGRYLHACGVAVGEYNSYGSRRGNHEVMIRGTFANIRLENKMVPGVRGGYTRHASSEECVFVYDCAMRYQQEKVPLCVIAGYDYGVGSSRDWAAKGTLSLGVRMVIAQSFERIHRSNLIGMGVLPCEFRHGVSAKSLKLTGAETFATKGLSSMTKPLEAVELRIDYPDGSSQVIELLVRLDTQAEFVLYKSGGVFPTVLEGFATR